MSVMSDYKSRYSELELLAKTNPFTFRTAARKATSAYPSDLRVEHRKLATSIHSTYDFFKDWKLELLPLRLDIMRARDSLAFRNALKKYLLLDDKQTYDAIDQLVSSTDSAAVQRFIDSHYTKKDQKSRRSAGFEMLHKSPDDLENNMQLYIDYTLYSEVARVHQLTIPDSESNPFKFSLQRRREKHEIKKYCKTQKKRIKNIHLRKIELEEKDSRLISKIADLHLDVVEVLSVRHDYQKKLDRLSPEIRKSPSKLYILFCTVTENIRNAYIEEAAKSAELANLHEAGIKINDVLVQIFDMSTLERNELMIRMKEYRIINLELQQLDSLLSSN